MVVLEGKMRWCEGIARCRYSTESKSRKGTNKAGSNAPLSLIGRRRTVTWTDDDPVDAMAYCDTNESQAGCWVSLLVVLLQRSAGCSGKLLSVGTEFKSNEECGAASVDPIAEVSAR